MADISKIKTPDNAEYTIKDSGAVRTNQGIDNAGKFLVVGNNGYVTVVTLSTWNGGNY